MFKYFNNHDLTEDDPMVPIFQSFIMNYPNLPEEDKDNEDEDYYCYVEEYQNEKGLCARLRDKNTGKLIVFWTSPNDPNAIEQKRGLLQFLSEVKMTNDDEYFKKDGKKSILVQGIFLSENDTEIELASYLAELFYVSSSI